MLGALIGAGANILGGLLGSREKDKDREMQREFAQSGIQWKVADAEKAGVHPLYALGAQTHSFAPVSTGGGLAEGVAAAGQDVSRAVNATSTQAQRITAYDTAVRALTLKRMELENTKLASDIAKINQAGTPPAFPSSGRMLIDGQGNSGLVNETPMDRQASAPGMSSHEAGAVSEMGFARTPTGWAPVMSKDVKDRLDDDLIGTLSWNMRNRVIPTFSRSYNPPTVPLAPGMRWAYDPVRQEYYVTRKGDYRPIGKGRYSR